MVRIFLPALLPIVPSIAISFVSVRGCFVVPIPISFANSSIHSNNNQRISWGKEKPGIQRRNLYLAEHERQPSASLNQAAMDKSTKTMRRIVVHDTAHNKGTLTDDEPRTTGRCHRLAPGQAA